jgi:uncharacterized protein YbjT (DUF2867 family)
MHTALIIGATGLVGKELVNLLLTDANFSKVVVFGRRSLNIQNEKLVEHLIDFDTPAQWQDLVKGDVLFSTLGTTLKQAGSQNAQYKVDYFYQYQFAEAASRNGVPTYVLVSSASASPDSILFYSRMKGTLELEVKKLSLKSINIIQPGLLHGHRDTERTGEKIGYSVLSALTTTGLVKKYRPIHGKVVARAMINAALSARPGAHTFTLDEVFNLAGE